MDGLRLSLTSRELLQLVYVRRSFLARRAGAAFRRWREQTLHCRYGEQVRGHANFIDSLRATCVAQALLVERLQHEQPDADPPLPEPASPISLSSPERRRRNSASQLEGQQQQQQQQQQQLQLGLGRPPSLTCSAEESQSAAQALAELGDSLRCASWVTQVKAGEKQQLRVVAVGNATLATLRRKPGHSQLTLSKSVALRELASVQLMPRGVASARLCFASWELEFRSAAAPVICQEVQTALAAVVEDLGSVMRQLAGEEQCQPPTTPIAASQPNQQPPGSAPPVRRKTAVSLHRRSQSGGEQRPESAVQRLKRRSFRASPMAGDPVKALWQPPDSPTAGRRHSMAAEGVVVGGNLPYCG